MAAKPTATVVPLHEAMSRALARELGVSVAIVDACRGRGIGVAEGLSIIAWFEALPASEREIVRKAAKRRRGR